LKKRHHHRQQQAFVVKRAKKKKLFRVNALVSVDVGPAAVLGTSVMLSSIALYQIRASRPEVSRDKDVFFSSVGLLCGGILVFQGWRLDPLMLFGQLMTAGTAVAFASETISLRQNLLDVEEERGYGSLEDDDEEDYEEFGGRRGRKGRRGGGRGSGRGRRNNRGYALPSQTQSGFRRFEDSFEDLYEDEDDMERGGRGFSSVQQEGGGSGGRYVGSGVGSRKGIPPSAPAAASSSFSLGEEDEEDLGSDFSREFRRSRRKDRDEDEDADASSSSPSSSSVSSKPSLDVWGSEGDDVF